MAFFFLIFLFTSCAQRIQVPINRFQTPETIGGGMEIEYRSQNYSQGKLSFAGGRTDNALVMGEEKAEEVQMAIGFSRVDLFLEVPQKSSSLIGLKIQFLGEPKFKATSEHKLAFSLGFGTERDTFKNEYSMDLLVDTQDYSFIHGFRFSPNLLVYEAISFTNYSFRGKIKDAGSLSSSSLEYRAQNIMGLNAGVELSSLPFTFKLEYAAQQIKWNHTKEKTYHGLGLAVGAVF